MILFYFCMHKIKNSLLEGIYKKKFFVINIKIKQIAYSMFNLGFAFLTAYTSLRLIELNIVVLIIIYFNSTHTLLKSFSSKINKSSPYLTNVVVCIVNFIVKLHQISHSIQNQSSNFVS
jgi:hypothetical protein